MTTPFFDFAGLGLTIVCSTLTAVTLSDTIRLAWQAAWQHTRPVYLCACLCSCQLFSCKTCQTSECTSQDCCAKGRALSHANFFTALLFKCLHLTVVSEQPKSWMVLLWVGKSPHNLAASRSGSQPSGVVLTGMLQDYMGSSLPRAIPSTSGFALEPLSHASWVRMAHSKPEYCVLAAAPCLCRCSGCGAASELLTS